MELLSQSGHRVYGTTRNLKKFKTENSDSQTDNVFEVDLTDEKSIQEATGLILKKEGTIDVLINNAGYGTAGAAEETGVTDAMKQFDVNFFAVLRTVNAVLPSMRSQKSGLIINISSIVGQMGIPFQSIYCASKYAIEGYTESLRMEVKNLGIKVVLVEPGDVKTGFTDNREKFETSDAYAGAVYRSIDIVESDERKGYPPEKVARLIEKIIREKSPRLRYSTGPFEQILSLHLKRLVPHKFFEFLIMDHMKMNK